MKMLGILWVINDCIMPRARPLSMAETEENQARQARQRAECEKRVAALPDEETALVWYLGESSKLLEAEDARQQSVQARLTTIVGLSSIAATIVFGSILAQASGTMHIQQTWLRWTMALGTLYLALQLCRAIFAAIGGLERRSYSWTEPPSIFPLSTGEARFAYLRRRIRECSHLLTENHCVNNEKVTQMAIAHRALRNFLWFLLFVALIGTYGGVTSATINENLTEKLRQNHQLQELLRGPQGPPGPKGEPCTEQRQQSPAARQSKRH
jgi:hypothetical protein